MFALMENPVPRVHAKRSTCLRIVIASALSLPLAGPGEAEAEDAAACARADLAAITKLEDAGSGNSEPTRIHEAVMRMLDARSACTNGEFSRGLALYRESDLLADHQAAPELKEKSR